MKGLSKTIGPSLLALLLCSAAYAQSGSQTFVGYVCRHKPVSEIVALLKPLLPDQSSGTDAQLVADPERNQLLLSGPDYIHAIVKELLAEVDRPTAPAQRLPATPPRNSYRLHAYELPAQLQPPFLEYLQQHFGSSVRAVIDGTGKRVFVTARDDQHQTIADVVTRTVAGQRATTAGSTGSGRNQTSNGLLPGIRTTGGCTPHRLDNQIRTSPQRNA